MLPKKEYVNEDIDTVEQYFKLTEEQLNWIASPFKIDELRNFDFDKWVGDDNYRAAIERFEDYRNLTTILENGKVQE